MSCDGMSLGIKLLEPRGVQRETPNHLTVLSDSVTPWTAAGQASLPPLSPGVCSNSCPLSQ